MSKTRDKPPSLGAGADNLDPHLNQRLQVGNANFNRPEMLSPSPNVAQVVIESEYVEGGIIVDVLRGLHGIEEKEIFNHYALMKVNGTVIAPPFR